jgi:hypothetical protein
MSAHTTTSPHVLALAGMMKCRFSPPEACDGVEPTPDEDRAAIKQADKAGKREEVLQLLATERHQWHCEGAPHGVNRWMHA